MDRRPIELRIAGQRYRVVSSASEEELNRIAELVSAKVAEFGAPSVPGTRPPRGESAQTMLLAALALAHDVMVERERRASLEKRTQDLLARTLVRIEEVLGPGDETNGAPPG